MFADIFGSITLLKALSAIVVMVFIVFVNAAVLKPWKILSLYSKLPGSIVRFKIGGKVMKITRNVKKWSQNEKSTQKTSSEGTCPHLSSKVYEDVYEYSDTRFLAENIVMIPLIKLTDPALIAEYYKNPKAYYKYQPRTCLTHLRYSLGGSEGERWRVMRKTISEAFHFESLRKIIPLMEDTIKEKFATYKSNEPEYSVLIEIQKITGEVVGRSFFGERLNDYKINGKELIVELADLTISNSKLLRNPLYQVFGDIAMIWSAEFRKCKRDSIAFTEFVREIMKKTIIRIKNGETNNGDGRKGILQLLVERTEDPLTEDELLGNFINFFLAGTDTSGHHLAMITYFLIKHPEIKEKLVKDIDAHWDGKSRLSFEIIQKMDYMQAVIDEAFRLAAPVPNITPRKALVDHFIKDIPIKKGTMVTPHFLKSNFNSNLYKDRDVFRPERWIKGDDAYERPSDPFAFIPFSAGGRNCIGQHFSVVEMKIFLCHFLKTFEFDLAPGSPEIEMVLKFLIEPQNPVVFSLKRKQNI